MSVDKSPVYNVRAIPELATTANDNNEVKNRLNFLFIIFLSPLYFSLIN